MSHYHSIGRGPRHEETVAHLILGDDCPCHQRRHDCQPDELKYVADIAAPGYGQAWECRVCSAPWVKLGASLYRAGDVDNELRPEDVI